MSYWIYDCILCNLLNHYCKKESLLNTSECSKLNIIKKNESQSSKQD